MFKINVYYASKFDHVTTDEELMATFENKENAASIVNEVKKTGTAIRPIGGTFEHIFYRRVIE
jgi:hypothetical protein